MGAELPIHVLEQEIISRLRERRRLILSSPTGSGKSTQVPQMLLRHGLLSTGSVAILQPRRIAARLLAVRVAEEVGSPIGRKVGYQIRFETVAGPETKIKYVTEGILLRQMLHDPKLTGISALIFDEFHERHLYGDITLARALDLQERARPDLMIAVMSATLEVDALEKYLAPCARLSSEGRVHSVDVEYAPDRPVDERPVWERAADAFASHAGDGDTLIFMPGAYEIARTIDAVRARPESKGHTLLPLHGELAPRDQDAAVARHGRPKVVVATNVAETSLTIDGIRLVVDSGLARIPRYDPHRGINTLLVEKISRASADQRTGRAGRTAPGVCVRLWTEREHSSGRPPRETPEIKRLDLAEVALTLKAAGVKDLRSFRWLEAPNETALAHAEELLHDLGALRKDAITDLGRRMVTFPLHPRYGRMLLAAKDLGCVRQAALIAALTQGRDLLLRKVDSHTHKFRQDRFGGRAASDFKILMKAWEFARDNDFRMDACRRAGIHAVTARQVGPLADQFLKIAEREGLDTKPSPASDESIGKCILSGFSDRVARRADTGTLRCEMVRGRTGVLARESAVRQSPLLVVAEVREVDAKDRSVKTLLSLATEIDMKWLRELFPDDFSRVSRVTYDPGSKRVLAEEQTLFRDLVLEKRRLDSPPAEEAARLLAEEVVADRLRLKKWDHGVEQWILRLNLLAKWCPDLALSPIEEDDRRTLIEQVCHGAVAYKDIKDRPVKPTVMSWLDEANQRLVEKHAPERLAFPNGKKPKITYAAGAPPSVAMRIQELYGLRTLPSIALGRVTPLVQILAPSMRPVQITQDLEGFWREHYPRVRKELQRKYPKHEWKERPD